MCPTSTKSRWIGTGRAWRVLPPSIICRLPQVTRPRDSGVRLRIRIAGVRDLIVGALHEGFVVRIAELHEGLVLEPAKDVPQRQEFGAALPVQPLKQIVSIRPLPKHHGLGTRQPDDRIVRDELQTAFELLPHPLDDDLLRTASLLDDHTGSPVSGWRFRTTFKSVLGGITASWPARRR